MSNVFSAFAYENLFDLCTQIGLSKSKKKKNKANSQINTLIHWDSLNQYLIDVKS